MRRLFQVHAFRGDTLVVYHKVSGSIGLKNLASKLPGYGFTRAIVYEKFKTYKKVVGYWNRQKGFFIR